MDLSNFKRKFIEEAHDLLNKLDNVLVELEQSPEDISGINEAFRVMHTIKGAGGMYGFEKVVEITHEIENLYDLARNQKIKVSSTLLELTFSAVDHLRNLLVDENFTNEDVQKQHENLREVIGAIKNSVGVASTPLPIKAVVAEVEKLKESHIITWNILFYPNDELVRRCVNLTFTFQDLFLLGRYVIHQTPFLSDNEQYWSIYLITDKPYSEIEDALMFILDYCKVQRIADFDIFDDQQLQYRDKTLEISLKGTEVNEAKSPLVEPKEVVETSNADDAKPQNRIAAAEPESIPQLRKLPGQNLRQNIKISASRINVDASKLDTLMYLVSELVTTKSELILALQNRDETKAFETAEKIEKLSKQFSDNALNIRLVSLHEVSSRFNRLVRDLSKQLGKKIEFIATGEDTELDKSIIDVIGEPIMHLIRNCIDHGIESPDERTLAGKTEIGLVRFEAFKSGNSVYINISDDGKGIDTSFIYRKAVDKGFINAGVNMSNKEILDLIFLPGFSTAQSLTEVSGRGVGMDIVLKKIQEIRGEISIASTKGQGTMFSIKLQQTISIIDTLLFSAGDITYAVPVEDVESCDIDTHENITNNQSNLIPYNEELIPYINLREKFSDNWPTPETEKLIVINKQNKRYAIVSDRIIGEYQAVVKSLGETFYDIKFLSGASILGDGSIAMLLDTDRLRNEISTTVVNELTL